MSKIIVAYWSQTGNTEAMANAVGEGIKAAGGEADVVPVSAVSVDELKAASSFALGCPAMGAEVLEAVSYTHLWSQNCLRQCTDIGWVKLCGAGVSD